MDFFSFASEVDSFLGRPRGLAAFALTSAFDALAELALGDWVVFLAVVFLVIGKVLRSR